MSKGQVVVQREKRDGAFTYLPKGTGLRGEKKSFYLLPCSKGSLVLSCTDLFERMGNHMVTLFLHLKSCMLLWVKFEMTVFRCFMNCFIIIVELNKQKIHIEMVTTGQ